MKNKISFGTDGIRGDSDQFPFTKEALIQLGKAISKWALQKYNNEPNALIVYDTRFSSDRIKRNLSDTLALNGITVWDGGVLPTPAVLQLMLSENQINFGIMISASHNPYQDNGIKIFGGKNGKLTRKDELVIESFFENPKISILSNPKNKTVWSQAHNVYKSKILSLFKPNYFNGIKVVLDCANGATFKIGPEIFEALGAEVITIANKPNGKNINENCGALHVKNLQKKVVTTNADAGFAFDGDGDRVIAVSKEGIIKDGDDLMALLLTHPKLKNTSTIVGTVMTNYGFDKYLQDMDKMLIRTKVGDKYVSAKLEEKNLLIGGETSGHIIIRDYLPTGDGIFAALCTLESIIINKNYYMESFAKFPQVLINVPITKKDDLTKTLYSTLINEHQEKMKQGRIIVRYSGTENVLRVMTEDPSMQNAQSIAKSLANQLQKALCF
ncbi:hypothetical protein KAW80_03130 [Candidatus Babeliales bacterium]|nr:hypothetical protein [Candidatus Babeliales bacterium]